MSAENPDQEEPPGECAPGRAGQICRAPGGEPVSILTVIAGAIAGIGSAAELESLFEFLVAFANDPLGMITGPVTNFLVNSIFAMFAWLFGFMYSIAGLFVDIFRTSLFAPIANVYRVITWPVVTFIDGYYAMALSTADGAGPFAPVIVIMFWLAFMVMVYFAIRVLATLLSIFIGVQLDKLALSLWKRTSRLSGRLMPLPSRLDRDGGDG